MKEHFEYEVAVEFVKKNLGKKDTETVVKEAYEKLNAKDALWVECFLAIWETLEV